MAANTLQFSTYLNPAGFQRGIREMEALSKTAGGRISSGLSGGFGHGGGAGGGISGIIRESLVIIREFGRGNYTRIPGSATLLAQYLGGLSLLYKSSATEALKAAEASGKLTEKLALEAAVAGDLAIAKEKAAFAANFDDEALNAESSAAAVNKIQLEAAATAAAEKAAADSRAAQLALASARVSVTAFGIIAIAVLALAVPLFLLYRHYANLRKEHKAFTDSVDASRHTFSDEAKAIEENRRSNQELDKWLRNELSSRKDLMDVTQQRIDQLHQETEAQEALMRARGDSASAINQYEIQQLQIEQKILQSAKDQAQASLDAAQKAFSAARAGRDEFASHGITVDGKQITVKSAQDALDNALKAKDAQSESLNQNEQYQSLLKARASGKGGALADTKSLNLQTIIGGIPSDKQTVNQLIDFFERQAGNIDVEGKKENFSIDELNTAIVKNQKYLDAATDKQNSFSDAIGDSQKDITTFSGDVKKFGNELAKNNTELGIRSGVGEQTAALEDVKKSLGRSGNSDSLVRVGNFLGTARSGIESMTSEMVRIARSSNEHLQKIESNTSKSGGFSY